MSALVKVEGLSVDYGASDPVHAVRSVDLAIEANQFVGLVGESGCGKSTLAMAIARLERPPARIVDGTVRVADRDWTRLKAEEIRPHRWRDVAIVLQSGMNALNPIMTIGAQFLDVMREHTDMSHAEAQRRAKDMMDLVQIQSSVLSRYPHELSGGMKQRAAIALAMVLGPRLVIMDEPTTALDVVVQRQILENLKALRRKQAFAMLFVSHDLGLILELCDRVVVMYGGEVVEQSRSDVMLEHAYHPYTRALIHALPDPELPSAGYSGIPGTPPELRRIPDRCMFAPRCPVRREACLLQAPALERLGDIELRCIVTREEVRRVVGTRA